MTLALVVAQLAVFPFAMALGWWLRRRRIGDISSVDMRRHHVSAVIWLNVQNLTGYQRPDPGAPLNGRNPHER